MLLLHRQWGRARAARDSTPLASSGTRDAAWLTTGGRGPAHGWPAKPKLVSEESERRLARPVSCRRESDLEGTGLLSGNPDKGQKHYQRQQDIFHLQPPPNPNCIVRRRRRSR
jgi:hypothetical protein